MRIYSRNPLIYLAILTLPCVLYALPYAESSFKLSKEDDDFLDLLERASILFFWEQADPQTGAVRDRAISNGQNEDRTGSFKEYFIKIIFIIILILNNFFCSGYTYIDWIWSNCPLNRSQTRLYG